MGLGLALAGLLVLAFPPAPPGREEIERRARALGMVYREEVLPVSPEPSASETTPPGNPPKTAGGSEREVEVYIRPGATSTEVARQLEAAGIVANAADFDRLLEETGASRRLVAGRHLVKAPVDPRRLAEQLCRQE